MREPGSEPIKIERRGASDLLQVSFRQADIAPVAQSEPPNALRERPFDTRPFLIKLTSLFRLKINPYLLNRLLLWLGLQLEATGLHFGSGTAAPFGAG